MRSSIVEIGPQSGTPSAGTSLSAATSAHSPVATTTAATDRPRSEADEAAADFEDVRHRLFGIAYQTLGRAADAEDVVQDVWIRWQGVDRAKVRDRVAFLVTVTTRVALNAATSARSRREVSVGGWLPERTSGSLDPASGAVRDEELEVAVQLLIERLPPAERAVYVLREAFDYPFREIAAALEIAEANARQMASRARKHLVERRHHGVDPAERDGLLEAFLTAARAGDMARLIDLLTGAATLGSGRSGRIRAPRPSRVAAAGPYRRPAPRDARGSASRIGQSSCPCFEAVR